ncbi:MAG: hypothetical protein JO116_17530, partial [Planctomycetaceae bacterium]|nr:hypothetical protein [Planctomycetaceae bacterium]
MNRTGLLPRWLSDAIRRQQRPRRERARRRTTALVLEPIEDRIAPATFAVSNVAGLINAIKTANTNQENNTIQLAATGSYVLSAVDNTTDGPNGLPVIATSGHTL